MQGGHHKSCHAGSCTASTGNSALQTRAKRAHASVFFEDGDDDDGAPVEPETGATTGKSFAQTGMKRDHTADFMEEEEDSRASSQQRQPHKSSQTRGMVMLQSQVRTAATEVIEEKEIQEDSSETQLPLEERMQEESSDEREDL